MPLVRYPGAKSRLVKQLRDYMPDPRGIRAYAEPFIGAGSVFEALAPDIPAGALVRLSDKDEDLVALWRVVQSGPLAELLARADAFTPSTSAFYEMRDQSGGEDLDRAFRKLILHQTSFSGLGAVGGPIGGRAQESKYGVGCRWSPATVRKNLTKMRTLLARHRVTIALEDFGSALRWAIEQDPASTFVYSDPPYHAKGDQCYLHTMSDADHARLSSALRDLQCPWLLSYDNATRVADLYAWAWISEPLVAKYSISGEGRRSNIDADGVQGDVVIAARRPDRLDGVDDERLHKETLSTLRLRDAKQEALPGLLERLSRREHYWKGKLGFATFAEFVAAPSGLGSAVEHVTDAVRRHAPQSEVLRVLGQHGTNQHTRGVGNTNSITNGGMTRAYTLARLDRDAPELAAKVRAGEVTAHAAAKSAGFRKPQNPIKACARAWARASSAQRVLWLDEQQENARILLLAWSLHNTRGESV